MINKGYVIEAIRFEWRRRIYSREEHDVDIKVIEQSLKFHPSKDQFVDQAAVMSVDQVN
jgi:hypothetical protein